MAITTTQVSNLTAFIGQGDLWVGVTAPADGALLALTAGVPATGTNVGLTGGPAEFDIEQVVEGIHVEQAVGKVGPRIKEEKAKLKVKLAEATYLNFVTSLALATSGTDTTPSPDVNYVKLGGKRKLTTTCVVLVAPIDDGARYQYIVIYKATAKGTKLHFKAGETQMFEVEFTAWEDVTRTLGDRLFQYCEQSTTG
jgi:hypothetical protein